jgi:hypothetical protein
MNDTRLFQLQSRQQLNARNLECELADAVKAGNEYYEEMIKDEIVVARSRTALIHKAPTNVQVAELAAKQ